MNVTSIDYKKAKLNKNDLNLIHNYDAKAAYACSKLANVLFTVELSKRLQGTRFQIVELISFLSINDERLSRRYRSNR